MARAAKKTRSKTSSGSKRRGPTDQTSAFAEAVVAGELVANRLVRLACERHLRDVKAAPASGFAWDVEAAEKAISFFPKILRLAEGEHAGKPFALQPWQQFIVGSLFGWKRGDGCRRFRTAYIEIGKGNGKTPLAAGIGLLGLIADGEAAAEIYSAATGKDQAKICYRDAERMVEASPALSSRILRTVNNLAFPELGSYFRPVSAEHRGLDGKRVHMALVDELHEHPSAIVVDKMRAGTKGRRQALIVEITNSGFDRHSVCYEHHDYSVKILQGVLRNEDWFAFVCGLDACEKHAANVQPVDGCTECDDWRDERVWRKANPNLGVSIPERYLREQVAEAVGMPSKQNIVRRLNFCQWTESAERFLDMAVWDSCGAERVTLEHLAGLRCFGGLDLASTTDLAAFVIAAELGREIALVPFFWVPAENVQRRVERDRVPYDVWIRDGLIEVTEGNVIDYDVIRRQIGEVATVVRLAELAFDPFNGVQLATQLLGDGLPMVEFRQGFLSMNPALKAFETRILGRRIRHGGNPVLRWMASNLTVEIDAAGNVKPSKAKSTEKIDGMVAATMAIGRLVANGEEDSGESVYDSEGILLL